MKKTGINTYLLKNCESFLYNACDEFSSQN